MFFGFGSFFYISLLLVNSVAILSEDRFLARIGWSATNDPGFGTDEQSIKSKLIGLINSVRVVLRAPLILVNTVVIFYLLLLG
ncbi:Yos1-like protein [Protomyces lactucae-debilis]|uniref:Yos1-like protein n=1 Tax=Protomyces lactucae-debilis TaxID=2754530 RepID=A0A1Y2FJX7_PROLT|nr:Yos1-like protein [Protomyces lactucae-debilis]ORY84239.1 Yos1-like protein [Protomyces lactucae-debilis]